MGFRQPDRSSFRMIASNSHVQIVTCFSIANIAAKYTGAGFSSDRFGRSFTVRLLPPAIRRVAVDRADIADFERRDAISSEADMICRQACCIGPSRYAQPR
jgi:hypothetical protein